MRNYILLFISMSFLINLNVHSSPRDATDHEQCDWSKQKESIDNIFSDIKENIIGRSFKDLLSDSLQKSQIVVIGESHIEALPKQIITNNIDLLYNNDFKYIAIEMINKTSQPELTQFCQGKITKDEFRTTWEDNWSYTDQTDNYLNFIHEACARGIKVIAVDERDNPDLLKQTDSEENNWRNRRMAQNIIDIHNTDSGNILFLTGSIHAFNISLNNASPVIKSFVGNSSALLDIKKGLPNINITSINIKTSFPLTNTNERCADYNKLKKLKTLFPNKNYILFQGSSLIPFDYIYIKLK